MPTRETPQLGAPREIRPRIRPQHPGPVDRLVERYDVPDGDHPHGFSIDEPDVLAWDPGWQRLYVAAESGVLSVFWLDGTMLRPTGEIEAPHAHTVPVDPRTHRVHLPLENVGGHPVLPIYEPDGRSL
jgi:hypothetical protein